MAVPGEPEPKVNLRPTPHSPEEFCQAYAQRVFRVAAFVARGAADAEDIAQDALLKASLEVDLTVRGPLSSHLADNAGAEIPSVSKPHPLFSVDLFEPSGSSVQALGGDARSGLGSEEVHSRWLISGPRRYHLVVIYEGVGQFVREINVR